MEHGCYMTFPSYWECHHPNWRTPWFFRGVETTNQMKVRSLVICCSDFFSVSEFGVEIFYMSGDAGREELFVMVFFVEKCWFVSWRRKTIAIIIHISTCVGKWDMNGIGYEKCFFIENLIIVLVWKRGIRDTKTGTLNGVKYETIMLINSSWRTIFPDKPKSRLLVNVS